MKRSQSFIVLFASLAFTYTADASLINVDPALFEVGMDISEAFYGVRLSNAYVEGDPSLGPEDEPFQRPLLRRGAIYSTLCSPCFSNSEGQVVFGHDWDEFDAPVFWNANFVTRYLEFPAINPSFPVLLVRTSYNAFLAEFASPTSYVEIIAGGAPIGNYTRVDLWGVDGRLIATCSNDGFNDDCGATSTGDPGHLHPWSFSYTATDEKIAFITAGGWAGTQYVHSLRYEVPEPPTALLLLCGLLAMRWVRRRTNGTLWDTHRLLGI